jgi:hypothetical protein
MHGIGLALATTLDVDPEKFMKDNYTEGLQKYYAYGHFAASDFIGVLEMSELTCPKQEDALLERSALLAKNLTFAVQFALR